MRKITKEMLREEVKSAARRKLPFNYLLGQLCKRYDMSILNTPELIKEFEENYNLYRFTVEESRNRYSTAC